MILGQVDRSDVADPLGVDIVGIIAVAVAIVVAVAVALDALPGADVRAREPVGVVGPLEALGLVVYFEEDLHGVEVGAGVVIIIGVIVIALGRGAADANSQQAEEAEGREAPRYKEGRRRCGASISTTAAPATTTAAVSSVNNSRSTATRSIAFVFAAHRQAPPRRSIPAVVVVGVGRRRRPLLVGAHDVPVARGRIWWAQHEDATMQARVVEVRSLMSLRLPPGSYSRTLGANDVS